MTSSSLSAEFKMETSSVHMMLAIGAITQGALLGLIEMGAFSQDLTNTAITLIGGSLGFVVFTAAFYKKDDRVSVVEVARQVCASAALAWAFAPISTPFAAKWTGMPDNDKLLVAVSMIWGIGGLTVLKTLGPWLLNLGTRFLIGKAESYLGPDRANQPPPNDDSTKRKVELLYQKLENKDKPTEPKV